MPILTVEQITTLVAAVGALILGIMNRIDAKKKQEAELKIKEAEAKMNEKKEHSEEDKRVIDSAMQMVDRVDKLMAQMKEMEAENLKLKDKVIALEKALIQSPLYKAFFGLLKFPSVIIESTTGEIVDANASFENLFGYTSRELSEIKIYDLSLQKEETIRAIEKKVSYVESRLYRTKEGKALLVEVNAIHYLVDEVQYSFLIYMPKVKASVSQRIQDVLDNIIETFGSDYATIWVIHNGGSNKLSGLHEAVKPGNAYLFQDYRRLPSMIFQDLFDYLSEHKYIFLRQDDEGFTGTRMSLKHAKLDCILLVPVMSEGKLIGMLSTSWKGRIPNVCQEDVAKISRYSESDLIREVLKAEIHIE